MTFIPLILCPLASFEFKKVPRKGINTAYINSVEEAGAIVVPFAWGDSVGKGGMHRRLDIMLDKCNAVMVQGGCDIHPSIYRQKPRSEKAVADCDQYRDYIEFTIISKAVQMGKPLLAICRGMQMLNIVFGGTLYQNLPAAMKGVHDQSANPDRSHIAHQVSIADQSLLSSIYGMKSIGVNSIHHQGIRVLAKALTPTATAKDGLIEAVEQTNQRFCVGVQWHPEAVHHNNLFKAFVNAAIENRFST